MNAQYCKQLENKDIQCTLCPHTCCLKPGKSGLCKVRNNDEGVLSLPYYGKISSVAIDPIEKKPLYHFYPGSQIFSVGFWGCNLHCPFCQNYQISQHVSEQSRQLTPEELVQLAIREEAFSIAYTYSEPVIHFEFIKETAAIAKTHGLKNVLVSNGYLNPEPAKELLAVLDAANIDLKSFNPAYYSKVLGGGLEAVKRFIELAASRINLEVTTLIIPGENDSKEEIASLARFLGSINRSLPLHLSCYYPVYKYQIPATDPADIFDLALVAGEYLDYVYAGNVGYRETNTICPDCKNLLIQRVGYETTVLSMRGGNCNKCGHTIYGEFE